jgi:hypothetical protein
MDSLRNRGLIRVLGADGGPVRVVLTSEGMAAIGVEPDDGEASATADPGATPAEDDGAVDTPVPATEADSVATLAKSKPPRDKGRPGPPASPRSAMNRPPSRRRAPAPSRR